jgi:membrane protease YdiL (CAAX protease family)
VFLPKATWIWPIPFLVPLIVYGVFAFVLTPLRQSADWLRIGRIDRRLVTITVCLSVVSSTALVLCYAFLSPTLDHLDKYLPLNLFGSSILTATVFSLLNPLFEEAVFRGVLYQAIAAYWSWPVAILGSSTIFGIGHMNGYPPGATGAILAGLYGVALGVLRHQSQGLALGVFAHITADATIASIRLHAS